MVFPPLHPKEKGAGTQDKTYYSENFYKFPVSLKFNPSKPATVEKAQQDPQDP